MMFKQFLPKAFKVPEIKTYTYEGLGFDNIRPFLVHLPVSDNVFGIECFISKDNFDSYFITESHVVDLPFQRTTPKLILREYGESTCFFLEPSKPSTFPFQMDYTPYDIETISEHLKGNELIILQIFYLKLHTSIWKDRLTDQYVDYVNGINYPTNFKIVRNIQHKMIELQKKLEGGYRRNPRIQDAEKKLSEDLFQVEVRFMVFGESEKTRKNLGNLLHTQLSKLDNINTWQLNIDKDFRGFFKDMQLRRVSHLFQNQILCVSELANLITLNGEAQVLNSLVVTESIKENVPEQTEVENNDPNNVFSIFPRGARKHRENDGHFAAIFNKALKKLSLSKSDAVIQKITHGATLQKINFNLPSGLKLTDLTKAIPNIQTECALNHISFEQGDVAGTVNLVIPQEEREFVFVRDCVETLAFKDLSKKSELPLLFGTDAEGQVLTTCLTTIKHLLITGGTGNGKSVLLNTILCVLFALTNPKNLQAYMIDPKKVELADYKEFPHVQSVYTDMNEAEAVLFHLCNDMEKRYEMFEKKGYKNIKQYNRNEKEKLAFKLIVIDELADLIMTHPEVEDHIVRIAQMGRAAGLHLVIATQKPYENIITGLIKTNIYSRVCFLCDSGTSYKVALDEVLKFTLLGKGDGAYRFEGMQGIGRFQGAMIAPSEEEQARIIKKLSTHWNEQVKKEVIDLEAIRNRKQITEMKSFKRTILESGETRVTALQKMLNISNAKVQEYMLLLVDQKWVIKHPSRQKGYEVILSEEQRKHELEKLNSTNK